MANCLARTADFANGPFSSGDGDAPTLPAWFCVRTHPKHEHIAAAQLRHEPDVEVFLPRIKYRRRTRCGLAWVSEAVFRDYLFARFDWRYALGRVRHSRSVREVVHFGRRWPTVPDQAISRLRAAIGDQDLRVIEESLEPGDCVRIAEGALSGLEAVVTRILPARERVAVLIEFLGRQTTIEVAREQLSFGPAEQSERVRAPWLQVTDEPGSPPVDFEEMT
jgi:transcriptional antiterminator RfaH